MMDLKHILRPSDMLAATAFLTRVPLPVGPEISTGRGASMAWAFPLVGAALGLLAGLVANLFLALGTGGALAAIAALATLVLATGALHEDGLADCADGFGGASTPKDRLEIMQDSRIGTYGALALVLALLARWSGIAAFEGWALTGVLITVGAGSRAVMAFAMAAMVNARPDGLSASFGRPPMQIAWIALTLAFVIALLALGFAAIPVFLFTMAGAVPILLSAQFRIGGQTGDVLGAAQQCAEIAGLVAAIVFLT